MSLCVDCKASGIDAVATRTIGRLHYCSSHARKYFPLGAALPPENAQIQGPPIAHKEERVMPVAKRLDKQQILEDFQAGMNCSDIARKHGCNVNTILYHVKKAGLFPAGRPRKPRAASLEMAQAIVGALPKVRLTATHSVRTRSPLTIAGNLGAPVPEATGEAPVPPTTGQARCRVAMFEVEGSETAVRDAVNAIKSALAARSE